LLIIDIAVALAASAVIELAYTLFTPRPDEALDPLMLGLSAAMLVQVASVKSDTLLRDVGALLLETIVLGLLFAIRLFLAEASEKDAGAPNTWWIRWRRRRLDSTHGQ
jgi:hypothetical protein